jgi:hypothetical protein
MPPSPTPEAWAHIRHEYENTRRSIEDICLAHGISANTLRRRVKEWGWTMRRPPISEEGPEAVAPSDETATAGTLALGPRVRGDEREEGSEPPDPRPASERLQGAVARVMRAIEMTSARLTAGPVHLRETEMAARALSSLTRTLRDLNALLAQHETPETPAAPRDIEELRQSVMRKLQNIVAQHDGDPPPEDMDVQDCHGRACPGHDADRLP